ncbi:hypothetical protein ACS0TY_029239 [Phlomoides rotata]
MGRAPCCDKSKVKKGPWSPEEDATLTSHIHKHGTGGNWIALPNKIGLKRCGKSCRLRWLNYLRPNLKHGGYTEDEDNLICTLYLTIGSRWSIIAAQLPGRTDNDIKNYWNTRLKKKLLGKQRREHQTRRRITNKLACHDDHDSLMMTAPPPGNRQPDIMPALQIEQNFSYDHHLEASSHHFALGTDHFHHHHINVAAFDGNGMYESMPQIFDGGVNGVSAMDSSSQIWGDATNSVVYPSNYNKEMFTLFDEPRLLGYSQ